MYSQEINTKITLSWALKLFVTRVHTLFSMYFSQIYLQEEFNIKMLSHQHMNSHCGDKAHITWSYIHTIWMHILFMMQFCSQNNTLILYCAFYLIFYQHTMAWFLLHKTAISISTSWITSKQFMFFSKRVNHITYCFTLIKFQTTLTMNNRLVRDNSGSIWAIEKE